MDAERAARVQALVNHPAFKELQAEVNELHEKYLVALAKTMMLTGQPFDDFEYKRGYWAGLQAAIRYPDKAMKTLEREIAKSTDEEEAA